MSTTELRHPTGVYEDYGVNAIGINPPGAGTDPTRDTTDGTLKFASGRDTLIAVIIQMPHGWIEGSSIYPHVHWCKTSSASGTVKWQLKYAVATAGEAFPALSAFADATAEVADADTADLHAIAKWGAITMAGKKVSTLIKFVVQRQSNGGGDTYAADAKLLWFDIHYLRDTHGSRSEYTK